MDVAQGHTFGADLLKHLGIEEKNVKGFTLRVYAGECVTITVERVVRTEEETSIASAFDEYEVVKKE